MQPVQGLHHITAVASDAQANVDFYRNLLGQRFIKRTVNFDDPTTYHFYYGDEVGTPGAIMTFFPWTGMSRGLLGSGETATVAYSTAPGALSYWRSRLKQQGVDWRDISSRFGADGISFPDPDGMRIEIIEDDRQLTTQHWADGPIPKEYSLRGFHGVTLWLADVDETISLLIDEMGYTLVAEESADAHRIRLQGASNDIGLYVDILHRSDAAAGRFGSGSIHHIAFRTVDDNEQAEYRERLLHAGYHVTPVQDRRYFRSIYFRSPGGVLFEIATDAPGFAYDEPIASLGDSLRLPEWLEVRREEIERRLPSFALRDFDAVAGGSGQEISR